MKRLVLLLLVVTGCATAHPDLERDVDAILRKHPQQTIAIAYHDEERNLSLARNERTSFHAASTMKVPVMLALYEAISRGELSPSQAVRVKNDFVSIVDGSHFALDSAEDSDPALYALVGTDVPLEELMHRMIVRSSNLATDILIEFVGAGRVMKLMKEIGANDIRILRGVEDDKAFNAGMNNVTTAYDLMLVFDALAERSIISAGASQSMTDILLAQEFNDGIPSGVANGAKVAHKTGSITAIAHDAGIVFEPGGGRYVLVILTKGFATTEQAEIVMGDISRAITRSRGRMQSPATRPQRGDTARASRRSS